MTAKAFFIRGVVLICIFFFVDFIISLFLVEGLKKYYGINDSPNVLINGSSMAMNGFNRDAISKRSGKKVASYSLEGVGLGERYEMISHFYQTNSNVEKVIFEVSPVIFESSSLSKNIYTIFYPFMDAKNMDTYIYNRAPIKDYLVHKFIRCSRFDSRLMRLIIMGFMGNFDNMKTNELSGDEIADDKIGFVSIPYDETKKDIFGETMNLIEANGSDVILVMMPMYKAKYLSFNPNEYTQLSDYFRNFCLNRKGFTFIDLNRKELIENTKNFSDEVHLNVNGQDEVTKMIIPYLQ